MKKVFVLLSLFVAGILPVFAIYDFMETPDEYERFKEFYDLRTEYWRFIPNYPYEEDEPVMEFKNLNRIHNEKKTIIKNVNNDDAVIIIK